MSYTEQAYAGLVARSRTRSQNANGASGATQTPRNGRKPVGDVLRAVKARRCATEEQEQMALIAWVRVHVGRYPPLAKLFHVPNGGNRHIVEAVKFKNLGVLPGVPDLLLLFPHHGFHGWAGELKALDGKTTPAQRQMQKDLCALGYDAGIYYGWLQARDGLLRYLS